MDTEGGAESVMMEKDTVDDRSINLHPVSFSPSLSRPSYFALISSASIGKEIAARCNRRHNSAYARARTRAATPDVRRRLFYVLVSRVVCPCAHESVPPTTNTTAFILLSPHIPSDIASLLFSPRPARDHQHI